MATTKLQQRENSTNRMMQAAMIEFAAKGYSGARVTEIAKLSDVSPGLLGQRFGGKEELFIEVVQDLCDFFYEQLSSAQTTEDVFSMAVNIIKELALTDELRFGMTYALFGGRDVPGNCFEMMRERFVQTDMYRMIKESIDAGILVNSDPCLVMYTFLRSAASITKAFSESKVPLPDSDYFLQLIGFRNKNGKLEAFTREQKIRKVSNILSSEYTALYYVDLKTFRFEVYSMDDRIKGDTGKLVNKVRQGASAFEIFVDASVYPEDRPMMLEVLSSIRQKLSHSKSFSCYFRRNYNGAYLYTEMKVVKMDDTEDEPTAVALAFAEKDYQYREEMRMQQITERNAKIIQTLATEYSALFYVNVADRKVTSYNKNPESNPVFREFLQNESVDVDEAFVRIVNQYVYVQDRERLLQEARFDTILEKLQRRKSVDVIFRVLIPTGMEYRKLRFVKADSITDAPTAVSIALVSANNEIIGDFINERMLDEYASIYFADLENNYITAYKQSTTMAVGRFLAGPFNKVVESFAKEVNPEDVDKLLRIADPKECQKFLADEDCREIVYRVNELDHPWRRGILRVVERKEGVPSTIIVSFMGIDKVAANQIELSAKIAEQKQELEIQHNLLLEARSIAEAANQAKTTFLFNMSHDIRTPMNAIKGYTTLAMNHIEDKEKVNDCLQKIDVSGKHLEQLINDVLDMSRIEAGQVTVETKALSIPEHVSDVIDICRSSAEKNSITLHTSSDGIFNPLVYADEFHLKQIWINILSNAIKYSQPGEDVYFYVHEEQSSIPGFADYIFMIRDHGIGMKADFLPHIFETFAREKNTTLSGLEGTGLGMAIVQKLVDMMDGSIHIESEENVGTTVTVRFTLRIVSEGENVAKNEHTHIESLEGRRILVVEDNEMNREIICELLSDENIESEGAEDGDIAVSKIMSSTPGTYDAVLMDIQMPRMNGYEATKKIRSLGNQQLANIPIIAMTANAFEEDHKKSTDAGMNGHLAKPIDLEKVLKILSKAINQ